MNELLSGIGYNSESMAAAESHIAQYQPITPQELWKRN